MGVQATNGSIVNINNCILHNFNTALWNILGKMTINNTTVYDNNYGVFNYNTELNAVDSVFRNNRQYGICCNAGSSDGNTLTLENVSITKKYIRMFSFIKMDTNYQSLTDSLLPNCVNQKENISDSKIYRSLF
jgi:hypothetical protein